MRILVRAPNWIGDQVLAFPFFYYLRRAFPSAEIVSACVSWVEDIQFRGLVDDVIVLPRPASDGWGDRIRALEEGASRVRVRGPWNQAITLPNSISSAWLLARSGAKRRRGFETECRGILLNESLPWEPSSKQHRAQAYCNLLPPEVQPSRPVQEFWGTFPDNELDSKIPGELEAFDADRFWPSHRWLEPPKSPYWVMAPGATAESRRWPASYFADLARKVVEQTGWSGVVVGGPKEAPMASDLCRDRGLKLIDMTASGRVPELYRIFKESQFTVTNESGLAHVAALCGSATQIVCGAADPLRTRPLGPGAVRVAVNPIECWPCERNVCDLELPKLKFSCLLGIQAQTVWEEVQRVIRRN